MNNKNKAWHHGYNDFFKNEVLVNPYHYNTEEYDEWQKGNKEARRNTKSKICCGVG